LAKEGRIPPENPTVSPKIRKTPAFAESIAKVRANPDFRRMFQRNVTHCRPTYYLLTSCHSGQSQKAGQSPKAIHRGGRRYSVSKRPDGRTVLLISTGAASRRDGNPMWVLYHTFAKDLTNYELFSKNCQARIERAICRLWRMPSRSRQPRPCCCRRAWKTFIHVRLATLAGDKGALTLFGKKPDQHRLFAEHACHGVAKSPIRRPTSSRRARAAQGVSAKHCGR
jgi:hypothetical protein